MNMVGKRLLRSWWLWAAVLIFAFFIVPSLLSGGSDYHGVNLNVAKAQIMSSNVKDAVIQDREQNVELSLVNAVDGYTKISAQYPSGYDTKIANLLANGKAPGSDKSGTLSFHTSITKDNPWLSILISLLPILLIVGVLFFVMSQVQGGGNRVMSFGRSKAKMVTKDTPKTTFNDVAGADEAIEELLEIKEFLANPAKFQAIGAKIPRACCCTARPVPERRCSPVPSQVRPACRSTPSPVPTSSRCSSASVPLASGICSNRPSPMRRRSSSWTRSMRSVGTVVPVSAVAMTSASRR